MKATISAMVLGAAALASAAPHAHGFAHKHRRDALMGLSTADASRLDSVQGKGFGSTTLTSQKVQLGKNVNGKSESAPVTVNGTGPFVVDVCNESDQDIILVTWSNVGKVNPWDAAFVTSVQAPPDVTHTLRCNQSVTLSFDPSKAPGESISGSLAGIYPDTILNNGMIFDTWMEYTFQTHDDCSTTDISRLVNANGHDVSVHNYANKHDKEPACSSTMETCSFVCPEGQESCQYGGKLQNCPAGTPGTTASEDGANGGCGGMRKDGGYMKVVFK